ncbi:MAG: exopolysaccharide transport family protein [Ensifer adhaerens]
MLLYDREYEADEKGGRRFGPVPPVSRDTSSYELADIVDFFRRHAKLILITALTGTLLATIITLSLTKIYTASSTLVFDRNDIRPYEAVIELQKQERDKSAMETEMDLIKSREFLGFVVDDLNLMEDPYFNARLSADAQQDASSFWGWRWSPRKAQAGPRRVTAGQNVHRPTTLDPVNRDRVITKLADAISADRKGESLAMTIYVQHPLALYAAEIANGVAADYVVWSTQMKERAAHATVDNLRTQAKDLVQSIAKKEREIADFTMRSDLTFDPRDDVLRARTEQLNQQFILARVDEAGAWAKYNEAKNILSKTGIDSAGRVMTSDLLSSLRTEQGKLERGRAQLASKFGKNHPQVVEIDAELASNRQVIEGEINRILQELENDAKVATVRVQKFQEEVGRLQKQMQDRNLDEIRRRELERDLLTEQKRYDAVVLRLGTLDPEKDEIKATARIASFAEVPIDPSFPKPGLLIPIGGLASLLLGMVGAMAVEAADGRVRTARTLEAIVNQPNYLSIPDLTATLKPDQTLYRSILADPRSPFARSMRSLCLGWKSQDASKVVMFCSPSANEGKTTCAVGMATVAALNGLRSVILDMDPGPTGATTMIGAPQRPFNLDLVADGATDLTSISAQAPDFPFVHVLTSRLTLQDQERIFGELRRHFDLIIVDTPAADNDDDAIWLASHVDAVFVVAAAERTYEKNLLDLVERLTTSRARIIGSILNFAGIYRPKPVWRSPHDWLRSRLGSWRRTDNLGLQVRRS